MRAQKLPEQSDRQTLNFKRDDDEHSALLLGLLM